MRYLPVIQKNFQTLSTSGEEVLCICPWHADKSGHLYINARKGLYLCMSCGAKGSLKEKTRDGKVFDLPLATTDDVREKLRTMTAPKQQQRYYPEGWLRQFAEPTDYWTEERGLPQSVVDSFDLGYDLFSHRVTLPLRDYRGRILGTSFRRLDDLKPKYQHPKGFPVGRHLYGAWLLGQHTTVAVCEGQVDAIRCWASRVPAVATMGARITSDQVRVLQHLGVRKVVMMYDNDRAGMKGTVASYAMLRGSGIMFRSGWYRNYWTDIKDPDSLSGERLRKMYHSAVPILDWIERSGFTE